MLVYANRLQVQGEASESVVFKAIGGWLKEQLGFGLRPELLLSSGVYNGQRGNCGRGSRSSAATTVSQHYASWVLKHGDAAVRGRQWTAEVGVKKSAGRLEVSCVVKTDEGSTLVSTPVSASQPRVIRYIVNNVEDANEVVFAEAIPGEILQTVGEDRDSYWALAYDIPSARPRRPHRPREPHNGRRIPRQSDRTSENSDWPCERRLFYCRVPTPTKWRTNSGVGCRLGDGAMNVLSIPSPSGEVRSRLFLSDEIQAWGEESAAHFAYLGVGNLDDQPYAGYESTCGRRV